MLNLTAKAGDVLMIPVRCTTFRRCFAPDSPPASVGNAVVSVLFSQEALVHGALPWVPTDRLRRVLVLRYKPHDGNVGPNPPWVVERLSAETRELVAVADPAHVKALARRWGVGAGQGAAKL